MLNIRDDFPALAAQHDLVYLDSAATTLKPRCVVDVVTRFLETEIASVYRGMYGRVVEATERFDAARGAVAGWCGVSDNQVVFTRGATDGVNLVRRGLRGLKRVVTSVAEHHSNLLPWTEGLDCRVAPCDRFGQLTPETLESELASFGPTDLVAFAHIGNVIGGIAPVKELADVAHRHGALVLLDAAQSVSCQNIDPSVTGADFTVISAHKMLGPTGVGALIGLPDALERLDPVAWGGGMVESVEQDGCRLQPGPRRWEAGTPPIEGVLGWGAAIQYLESLGRPAIESHQKKLTEEAYALIRDISGVDILGSKSTVMRSGIFSMRIEGWESHAAARVLGQRDGICVRSGFHCAEPLHRALSLPPTLRASFHIYNNVADIQRFAESLRRVASLRIG